MPDRLARFIEREVLAVMPDEDGPYPDAEWDDYPSDYWDDVECSTCGGPCVL